MPDHPPLQRSWLVAFGCALLVAGALPVIYRYLPMVDWPEHCKMAAIRSHLNDPAYGFADYFETTTWFLPYQTFRWIQIGLGRLLGDAVGFPIALWIHFLGVPVASFLLLRRLGSDPWLVFVSLSVLVESNLLWGFAPYLTGMVVLLFGLSLCLDFLRLGGGLRGAGLAAVGVLAFFSHPEAAALYFGSAGLVAVVAWRQSATTRRRAVWAIAAVIPGVTMLLLFLFGSGWATGDRVATMEFFTVGPPVFRNPWDTLKNVAFDSGLVVTGLLPAILFVVGCVTGIVAGRASPQLGANPWRRAMVVVLGGWIALLFVAPSMMRGEPISVRLPSGIALLIALVLPVPDRSDGKRLWIYRAIWVVCGFGSMGWAHHTFARFDKSLQPLTAIAAAIPPRAKLATMIYEVNPDGIRLPALIHVGGYITTERGGLPAFTFQAGIKLKASVPRACMLVIDDWRPYYGWQIPTEKAQCWDYLVVRKGRAFPGSPFADPSFHARLLREDGDFQLWNLHP